MAPRMSFAQVCFVVDDLESAVDEFGARFGLDEWISWTYDGNLLGWQEYGGEPAPWSMRVALAGKDPQIELIEPLAGPSVYVDGAGAPTPGVHHVGYWVDSLASVRAQFEAEGIPMAQGGGGHGVDGDGAFGYFDTRPKIGIWTEVIEAAGRRPDPHQTFNPRKAD
jgi:methylmalonyl-CoA/ethylmalonyl-CoA epimerase